VKIVFKNFRQHTDREFILPDKGLILINGKSGAGKTTILKGIQQAFYDSVKKPYTFGLKTCSVTLEMNNLTIYRQKGPSKLVVNGFEDATAQSTIYSILNMTEPEFMASSYIQQKMESSLLTLSPADQLSFIEKLAFGENSPDIMKSKISEMIAARKETLGAVTNNMTFYDSLIEGEKIKIDEDMTRLSPKKEVDLDKFNEDRERYYSVKNKKENAIETLGKLNLEKADPRYEILRKFDQAKKHLDSIEKNENERISSLKETLNCIGQVWQFESQEIAQEKQAQFRDYPILINLWSEIERHKERLFSAKESYQLRKSQIESELNSITDIDCENIEKQIHDFSKQLEWIKAKNELARGTCLLTDRFFIFPSTESLTSRLKTIKEHLEVEIENCKRQQKTLEDEIASYQEHLVILKQSDKVLDCPYCQKKVVLFNGKLGKNIENIEKDWQETDLHIHMHKVLLKASEEKIFTYKNDWAMCCSFMDQIKNFPKKPINNTTNEKDCLEIIKKLESELKQSEENKHHKIDLQNRLAQCKTDNLMERIGEEIELKQKEAKRFLDMWPCFEFWPKDFITKEYCRQQLQDISQYIKLNLEKETEICTIQKQINTESKTLLDAKKEVNRLQNEVSSFQGMLKNIEEIDHDIKNQQELVGQYSETLSMLKPIVDDYSEWEKEEEQRKEILKEIERHEKQIQNYVDQKNRAKEEEKAAQTKLEAAMKLKQISEKAQMESVANTVNSINIAAKDFLDLLFPDEPCSVFLQPFKQTKDTSIKDKFSISIKYKGCEYGDINEISGGEYDRIVLAYQLALNSFYNSPILMLDEAFSAVEDELFVLAMDALKVIAQNKLILVVSHGANQGIFDEVIEV